MNREKQVEEIYEQIKYNTGSYDSDARCCAEILYDYCGYRKASEIFEKLEESMAVNSYENKSESYMEGVYDTLTWVFGKIDELKSNME